MSQRQRFVTAALVVLVTGAVQAGCGDDPEQRPQASPPAPAAGPGEVSDDFFTEPTYLGQTVTVAAAVKAILGPTSFVVGGEQLTGTVERFGCGTYADRFGLAEDATDYAPLPTLYHSGSAKPYPAGNARNWPRPPPMVLQR